MQFSNSYNILLKQTMSHIANRYEIQHDYPWLDTKFDILTGSDFEPKDLIRGIDTVYAWIQGRGLESIIGHIRWFEDCENSQDILQLVVRLRSIAKCLSKTLLASKELNGGHLYFFLDRNGKAKTIDTENNRIRFVKLNKETPYNFSDLFCSKGLYAASNFFNDDYEIQQAKQYCFNVFDAILQRRFVTDQQPFDHKNLVKPVENKYSHGPAMISIGTACLLVEHEQDRDAVDIGLKLIEHVLKNYSNIGLHWAGLNEYDFVEFINNTGAPYLNDGIILSDPGHALEFVGLSLKFTHLARNIPAISADFVTRLEKIESHMPGIFRRSFNNGFNGKGICKLYNLSNDQPFNTDMPWWSLPEAIRAAAYCWNLTKQHEFMDDLIKCRKAFFANYVIPHHHYFQYQTLNKDGSPINVIPATPDLDPGYHTGLSLIDVMRLNI